MEREEGSNAQDEEVEKEKTEKAVVYFDALGVCKWLRETCTAMGLRRATPVQQACIPEILQGKDVLAQAPTGSGKTAAFAIPILQKLSEDPFGVFALVLTPTRELALQIGEQFRALGRPLSLRDVVLVGGMDMTDQSLALNKRPHVVVATPGRLCDHIRSVDSNFSLKRLRFLVLDEADRLLSSTFAEDLSLIFSSTNIKRQTLFFSATMPETTAKIIASQSTSTLFEYSATVSSRPVSQLRQEYIFIPDLVKDNYLVYLLHEMLSNSERDQAIVFAGTRRMCVLLDAILTQLDIAHVPLHSGLTQSQVLFTPFSVDFFTMTLAHAIHSFDLYHDFEFTIPSEWHLSISSSRDTDAFLWLLM